MWELDNDSQFPVEFERLLRSDCIGQQTAAQEMLQKHGKEKAIKLCEESYDSDNNIITGKLYDPRTLYILMNRRKFTNEIRILLLNWKE